MKSVHNVSTIGTAREAALERLWELAVVLNQGMQDGLAERGLTLARAHLIWRLQQVGPSTQGSLSRALRVTPRNVTGLVDGLEGDGLAARHQHPSDRRATLVSLTPKGVAAAAAMRGDQNAFAQILFGDVTDQDIAAFVRTLDHVLGRIRGQAPPAGVSLPG